MKKSICIISLSQINNDSRVLRQIEYLSEEYILHVIGFGESPGFYTQNKNIVWHQIHRPEDGLARNFYTIFNRFLTIPIFPKSHVVYKIALECKCDIYYVNNWDALPFGVLAARANGSKVVLDLHESYKSWYWGVSAGLVKYVLKKYAEDVNISTTVVKALAEQHHQFGLRPYVIRNIPSLTNPEKIRMVYLGIASPERSSELMIRTLALSDTRYDLHLILVNHGSKYIAQLHKLADQIAPDRVTFYPPVAPQDIVQEISKFDVGFFPLPPKNYNYLIALPNKLFEFIAAGLAVVIGPSPSMAKIVNEYHCGKVAPSFSPEDLANLFNRTTPEEWDQMKAGSITASKTLNAEIEMQKLLDLCSELLN